MKDRIIITLDRQYGSGGHAIGKYLADKLGIAFFDEDIPKIAAQESDMDEKIFETYDELSVQIYESFFMNFYNKKK